MNKKERLCAALLIIVLPCGIFGQSSTAAGTVKTVLAYEQQHDNARDGIFNRRNLNIYKKWITPELFRLFLVELAREEREVQLHPGDKPKWGDGMDFSPVKEYCKENGRVYTQQYSLGKAIRSRSATIIPASFFYKACDGGEPTIYRFKVVRRKSRWLIDDIDYGTDGTNGTLRGDLTRAGN